LSFGILGCFRLLRRLRLRRTGWLESARDGLQPRQRGLILIGSIGLL